MFILVPPQKVSVRRLGAQAQLPRHETGRFCPDSSDCRHFGFLPMSSCRLLKRSELTLQRPCQNFGRHTAVAEMIQQAIDETCFSAGRGKVAPLLKQKACDY
jgi:hypothetical protein